MEQYENTTLVKSHREKLTSFPATDLLVGAGLSPGLWPITGCGSQPAQLIPQIVVNFRRHQATGPQPSMMMLWALAGVPLGVYIIVEEFNVALRVQP